MTYSKLFVIFSAAFAWLALAQSAAANLDERFHCAAGDMTYTVIVNPFKPNIAALEITVSEIMDQSLNRQATLNKSGSSSQMSYSGFVDKVGFVRFTAVSETDSYLTVGTEKIDCDYTLNEPRNWADSDTRSDDNRTWKRRPLGSSGYGSGQNQSRWKWMAFAVDERGAVGHGAGHSRGEAEQYARRNCDGYNCRIVETVQAQCHALYHSFRGGYWIGTATGHNEQRTRADAKNNCARFSGDRGSCERAYVYCQ